MLCRVDSVAVDKDPGTVMLLFMVEMRKQEDSEYDAPRGCPSYSLATSLSAHGAKTGED
jgi:hypothetical protein